MTNMNIMMNNGQSAGKTLVDIGWLVGALEFGGWLSLIRNQKKHSTKYTPIIWISNNEEFLNKTINDKVINILKTNNIPFYLSSSNTSSSSISSKIIIQGMKRVEKLLNLIEPYLSIKKEHAELLRKFIDHRKQLNPKDKYSDIEHDLWFELKVLNGKVTKGILREHTLNRDYNKR